MESADVSSQEKLDQMLHHGKITEEDYLRLSKAMAGASEQRKPEEMTVTERGKLRKNWENGLIGGLCAGYAKYFGVDERVVRTLLIVAIFLLSALGGVGLALIPLYFALCALVPWDEAEKAKAFMTSGRPRLFMGTVACLFFILPSLYSVLVLPRLESMYKELGLTIWSPLFQSTLAGRAIDSAHEYKGLLRQVFSSQFDHQMIFLLICVLVVLFTLFLGVIYSTLCNPRVRKYYEIVTIGLGLVWLFFIVLGTLYPLLTMTETIR